MSTVARLARPVRSRSPRVVKKFRRQDLLVAALTIVVFAALAVMLVTSDSFSWKAISATIAGLNPGLLIGLMAFLPLTGFSITVFYFIVGARFGPLLGLPVVIGVTAFHLVAAYLIARGLLRDPIERLLKRRGHHLPQLLPGEDASICLLAVLIPGVPYIARSYLLALTPVKLRAYFWICLPVYVARSYVVILAGDFSGNPDARQFALLAAIYAVKLSICGYILWRLRRHRHAPASTIGSAQ